MRQREKMVKQREDEQYQSRGSPVTRKDPVESYRASSPNGSKSGKGKRWEQLYELNKLQKETKEFMRRALAEDQDEDPECTFQPKISERSQQIVSQLRPDFMERNNIWLEQKREKMQARGMNKSDKDDVHCTFTPQLNPPPRRDPNSEHVVHLGVDKHIQRQDEARREKARREAVLTGNTKKTIHDPSKLTIPKNPNLSAFTKQQKRWHKNTASRPATNNEVVEQQIDEIMNDPTSLYLTNCTMHEAVMALHDKINSFEMNFD